MKSAIAQRLILFIFLIFTVWLSFYIIQPPEPQPISSASTSFSAERAFRHVQKIAQKPHPLGSPANDSARNYIVNELTEMGLEPVIQEGVGVSSSFRNGLAGYTKNIIAKIDGQNPEQTILLVAHYDSGPNTPGAADDAAGVAAILESARAIISRDTPLKNNIWILMTDGEERGLLGAELFVEKFKELEQIDLVLNFEARGSSGASMMFETSSPNSDLIPQFAKATPFPVANSLMYTVYKLLPNDTDLSVTKEAGLQGLNFALVKEYLNYHTMQDNPENLSLASLQHHGSNLLGNVRHFGNSDIDLGSTTEYVYFNNAIGGLVYYPSSWSFPLALITTLLFIGYLVFLFQTNKLNLGSYLGSTLLFILITAAGAAITYFGWQGIKILHPQYQLLAHGETYNHKWYLWGFTLLNIGLFASIYGNSWVQKKLSIQKLLAGSYTIWISLSLGTAWYLPTASYIFTWPVLMGLIGWITLDTNLTRNSWKSVAILAISLFPVLFLIPPYIQLIQVMLTTELLAVSIVLILLILGLAWPLVRKIIEINKVIGNTILAVVGLGCFLMASVYSDFDAQHKKQNDMNYAQNIDTNQAYWFSRDHTTDSWTGQFLGSDFEKGIPSGFDDLGENILYTKAESQKITPPTFEITADRSSDSLRFISLTVYPQNDGLGMRINWDQELSVAEFGLDGEQIFSNKQSENNASNSLNNINYFKDLSVSTEINLTVDNSIENPTLSFTFIAKGLPTDLIPDYEKREAHMMPKLHWLSNTTMWQTQVNMDTLSKAYGEK
jgi:hypothetical protein